MIPGIARLELEVLVIPIPVAEDKVIAHRDRILAILELHTLRSDNDIGLVIPVMWGLRTGQLRNMVRNLVRNLHD